MRRHFRTVIVGGGPAGLAPLVSASRDGRLRDLLAGGVAVVERGSTIGAGRLGRYAISSDSTAETFLTAVLGHLDPRLGRLADDPLCRELIAAGRTAVPLSQAGRLMGSVGDVLAQAINETGGAVLTGHDAVAARQDRNGAWRVELAHASDGTGTEILADRLLVATGGEQTRARLHGEFVAGQPLLPRHADTLVLSDDLLQPSGLAAVRRRLTAIAVPRVAIVGGSTSALAAAGLLLRTCGDLLSAPGSITVFHRRPLRVFYPSAEAARLDGYDVFEPEDICPVSGFVFRLAGFRLDSRDLLMRVLGVGGRGPEPRLVLHDMATQPQADTHRQLGEADLIVSALGYRPRALPVFDAEGQKIALRGCLGREPLVDEACRICDAGGQPVANLFGIGLAAGFVPRGRLGGEPSFRGQANGLWLWQTAVGELLVDSLLGPTPPFSSVSPGRITVGPTCPVAA